MNNLPGTVERIYRLILRAYPPEYLEMFGNEMQNTFIRSTPRPARRTRIVAAVSFGNKHVPDRRVAHDPCHILTV
jgi:hypothetical protein